MTESDRQVRLLVQGAVIAALYAVLTLILPVTAAGTVEFRIGEERFPMAGILGEQTYENGGYTARRIVSSNDIFGLFSKIVDKIRSITKSIFEGVKSLFNKG